MLWLIPIAAAGAGAYLLNKKGFFKKGGGTAPVSKADAAAAIRSHLSDVEAALAAKTALHATQVATGQGAVASSTAKDIASLQNQAAQLRQQLAHAGG